MNDLAAIQVAQDRLMSHVLLANESSKDLFSLAVAEFYVIRPRIFFAKNDTTNTPSLSRIQNGTSIV